jgi:hypothetical protein
VRESSQGSTTGFEIVAYDIATEKTVPLLRFSDVVELASVSADYLALVRFGGDWTKWQPLAVRLSDLKVIEPARDCVVPEACDALESPVLVGTKLLWRTAMRNQLRFQEFDNSRLAYIDLAGWRDPATGRAPKASFITPELGSFSEEGVVTDGRNIVFDSKGQGWQSKMVHYSFDTNTKTEIPVRIVRGIYDGRLVLGSSRKAVHGNRVAYIQKHGDAGQEISIVDLSTGVDRQITNDGVPKIDPYILRGKIGWFENMPSGYSYLVSDAVSPVAGTNACSSLCSTTEGFATAVYKQVLRRDPDAGGLTYWVSQINSGSSSRERFLQLTCSSSEYQALVASTGTQSQACTSGSVNCSCSSGVAPTR